MTGPDQFKSKGLVPYHTGLRVRPRYLEISIALLLIFSLSILQVQSSLEKPTNAKRTLIEPDSGTNQNAVAPPPNSESKSVPTATGTSVPKHQQITAKTSSTDEGKIDGQSLGQSEQTVKKKPVVVSPIPESSRVTGKTQSAFTPASLDPNVNPAIEGALPSSRQPRATTRKRTTTTTTENEGELVTTPISASSSSPADDISTTPSRGSKRKLAERPELIEKTTEPASLDDESEEDLREALRRRKLKRKQKYQEMDGEINDEGLGLTSFAGSNTTDLVSENQSSKPKVDATRRTTQRPEEREIIDTEEESLRKKSRLIAQPKTGDAPQSQSGIEPGRQTSGSSRDDEDISEYLDGRLHPTNFSRRITNMLMDSKGKLHRPVSSTTKPKLQTTTTALPLINNETQASSLREINLTKLPLLNGSSDHLDWSKLVKVVFKSAADNHTLYTVVMNSSELSNHPINDWSSEVPVLLRRDFEKLLQKWSNILPIGHLFNDLSQIIVQKVSSISAPANGSVPVNLVTFLNENLSNLNTSYNQNGTLPSWNLTDISKPGFNQSLFETYNITSNGPQPTGAILPNATSDLSYDQSRDASPKGFNVSTETTKSTKPWSSTQDLNKENGTEAILTNPTSTKPIARLISVGSTPSPNPASSSHSDPYGSKSGKFDSRSNRSMADMLKDMNDDHMKIEENVKEQASSLRHFIIICSVSVVLATSLVVFLIVLLLK